MKKLENEGMDKYGVYQEPQGKLEKLAAEGCPQCGTPFNKMVEHGNVIICPKCGTAPFEKSRG